MSDSCKMANAEAPQQGGTIAVLKAKMQAVKDEQEKLHDESVAKDAKIRSEMEEREKVSVTVPHKFHCFRKFPLITYIIV